MPRLSKLSTDQADVISRKVKELIAVRVSYLNACEY